MPDSEYPTTPPEGNSSGPLSDFPGALGTDENLSPASEGNSKSRRQRIGPYKVLHKIAEGGMGAVYMADQEWPLKRRVALKLIKSGVNSETVIARFEAERQALAMMDHPNIAQIFDAGTTDTGIPYFAMELVKGIPMTEYCDAKRLSVNQRLELFVPVCRAVQHAHMKGIIHRDLKPSNVLVAQYDGVPVAKVIDFGLAKAVNHQSVLTDKTMFTEFGQIVGTLQYMSPEQAEMNQLDIDTRSDIYSLGVMLYELLTGSTPLDRAILGNNALLRVLQIIREEEPPRPSNRLSESADSIAGLSEQRQIAPERLRQLLRSELDWIVMKSLEKDRARRYETASDLADELIRFLNGEESTVRPPSLGYKFRKTLRRHTKPIIAMGTVFLLLFAGLLGTGIMWRHARSESKRATAEAISATNARNEERRARQETELQRDHAATARDASKQSALAAEISLAESNYFLALARWEADRFSEAKSILQEIPEHYRKFEWYLSKQKFGGKGIVCQGHDDAVRCVEFSPGGERVVSGGNDQTIRVWESRTGRELSRLSDHAGPVTGLRYLSTSQAFVSGSDDGTVRLWRQDGQQASEVISRFHSPVVSLSTSQDGKAVLIRYENGRIELWDVPNRKRILHDYIDGLASITLAPKADHLVCLIDRTQTSMWEHLTGDKVGLLKERSRLDLVSIDVQTRKQTTLSTKLSSAFSLEHLEAAPIHQYIAVGGSQSTDQGDIQLVFLIDLKSQEVVSRHFASTESITKLRFTPDGRGLMIGGSEGVVEHWLIDEQRANRLVLGHDDSVLDIGISHDTSRVASCSRDHTIRIADVHRTTDYLSTPVWSKAIVSTSSSGKQFAVANFLQISFRDLTNANLQNTFSHPYVGVQVSPEGNQLITWRRNLMGFGITLSTILIDHSAILIDAASGEELRRFRQGSQIRDLCFSADGSRLLIGNGDGKLTLWNVGSGDKTHAFDHGDSEITQVAIGADLLHIASGDNKGRLRIWDLESNSDPIIKEAHELAITSLEFDSATHLLASASNDRTIKLWNRENGNLTQTLIGHDAAVTTACFSKDESRVFSSSEDRTIRVWNAEKGMELTSIQTRWPARNLEIIGNGDRLIWCERDPDTRTGSLNSIAVSRDATADATDKQFIEAFLSLGQNFESEQNLSGD
ncbi:MAG: protein kinase [Pirellulaceae bacterium]